MDASDFDPGKYPRTYYIAPGWKFFLLLAGALFFGGSLIGIGYASLHMNESGGIVTGCISLCGVLMGLYFLADTLKSKVILKPDAIEIYDLRPVRRMRRDEIAGLRTMAAQGSSTLLIIPKDAAKKKLKLPMIMKTDPPFMAWMGTLPDLDLIDSEAEMAAVAADRSLGGTKEERLGKLDAGRKLARAINGGAWALVVWGWAYPEPYALVCCALMILPWIAVAVVARSRGVITLDGRPKDARPNIGAAFFMPGLALVLRVMQDFQVLHWAPVHMPAVAAGAVLALAGLRADARLMKKNRAALVGIVLLAIPYGYGAVLMADTLDDSAPAQVFQTTVTGKYVTSGKGSHAELNIAPWGPVTTPSHVQVSWTVYRAMRTGDTMCVSLRPGRLGIEWYKLGSCGT